MTTPSRVQRNRQAEANRRKVRSTGRIGTRTAAPKARKPAVKKPAYRKTAAFTGLSFVFSGLCFATGSILWGVGAAASAASSSIAWRIEHRRELAQVKATGKPIDVNPGAARTRDLSDRPDPKPVELDAPRVKVHHRAGCPICARTDEHTHSQAEWEALYRQQTRPPARGPQQARPRAKPKQQHGPPGHDAKCTAKTKEACPYWRQANPRRTSTTKRATRRKT